MEVPQLTSSRAHCRRSSHSPESSTTPQEHRMRARQRHDEMRATWVWGQPCHEPVGRWVGGGWYLARGCTWPRRSSGSRTRPGTPDTHTSQHTASCHVITIQPVAAAAAPCRPTDLPTYLGDEGGGEAVAEPRQVLLELRALEVVAVHALLVDAVHLPKPQHHTRRLQRACLPACRWVDGWHPPALVVWLSHPDVVVDDECLAAPDGHRLLRRGATHRRTEVHLTTHTPVAQPAASHRSTHTACCTWLLLAPWALCACGSTLVRAISSPVSMS